MSSLDPARAWLAAGITGLARGKEWDVVATAEAPGAPGDEVVFLALPDGRLRAETEWDGDLRPLADALAGEIEPPFRALARRLADLWDGDAVEIARTEEGVSVRIDDVPTARPLPELERLGEARAATYVVRATRVEGRLFEVEVEPL
jgi:hypothetical protein